MNRRTFPAGPGRPRSDVRIPVSFRLRPEVWGLARALADTAFAGDFTAAIAHCIRLGSAGLDPAEPPLREAPPRTGGRRRP